MTTSQQRREAERQALRQQILDVARRLFAIEGYDKVTMRRIAKEIGYSATALYLHFPDKQQLLAEICHGDFRALHADFAAVLNLPDPLERIRAIGRAYVAFASHHPHHYRMMFMTPLADVEINQVAESCPQEKGDPSQDAYALLVTLVAQAIAAGRLQPRFAHADATAQLLWAGLHGVNALYLDKRNDPWVPWVPLTEQAEAMIDVLISGIAASQEPSCTA